LKRPDVYDPKCHEWDGFYFIGDSPTHAAQRRPGQWQLVYELRPLELIPFWLGIPFKPHHAPVGVIYDANSVAYFTAPASKIVELGHPRMVRGTVPLLRLLDMSDGVDRFLHRAVARVNAAVAAALRFAERIDTLATQRHREVRRDRSQVRAA
jgi:hypothetical protein